MLRFDSRRLDRWFLATHGRRLVSYGAGVLVAAALLAWPLLGWDGFLGHRPVRALTALCVAPFVLTSCWRKLRRELAGSP